MELRGISFPFRKGYTSFPDSTQDDTLVGEELRALILTPTGQRVMRPQYGCNARLYVFDNNDVLLRAKVRQEVLRAISQNEPRVKVTGIDVVSEENAVTVDIEYQVNRVESSVTVEIPRSV